MRRPAKRFARHSLDLFSPAKVRWTRDRKCRGCPGIVERSPIEQRNGRMLVLSRKKNESIVINNDITIVVVEIRGDKVRLGVEAPKEIPVHRREVYEAIKRNEKTCDKDPTSEAGAADA